MMFFLVGDVLLHGVARGRDGTKSVDDNWPRFPKTWKPLVKFAEDRGVRIGIENCPMSFTRDEWPGGKNLATTPTIWRRMFEDISSDHFGLNFDPSHCGWQMMDYVNWSQFFSVLGDAGYRGPVCIEVEDRAYEGSLANRKASLVQSGRYLRQFMP